MVYRTDSDFRLCCRKLQSHVFRHRIGSLRVLFCSLNPPDARPPRLVEHHGGALRAREHGAEALGERQDAFAQRVALVGEREFSLYVRFRVAD